MFAALSAFLLKIGIGSIASKIADAYAARQAAQTDAEKIAADERIKTLEMRRDVQVAEAGSRINALVRLGFAAPPMIYLAKLYVWDKVLGWGVTDPLSDELSSVMWAVISFYFISETTLGVTRIIKRR